MEYRGKEYKGTSIVDCPFFGEVLGTSEVRSVGELSKWVDYVVICDYVGMGYLDRLVDGGFRYFEDYLRAKFLYTYGMGVEDIVKVGVDGVRLLADEVGSYTDSELVRKVLGGVSGVEDIEGYLTNLSLIPEDLPDELREVCEEVGYDLIEVEGVFESKYRGVFVGLGVEEFRSVLEVIEENSGVEILKLIEDCGITEEGVLSFLQFLGSSPEAGRKMLGL